MHPPLLLQTTAAGILGGIVKGFKGEKMFHTLDVSIDPKSSFSQLEGIFSRPPFPDLSPAATNNEEIELNIGSVLSVTVMFLFVDSSLTTACTVWRR